MFDTSFSRDFSLIESAKEFVERYKTSNNPTSSAQLPMLSGICPGWICYAEKTHGNLVPLIDTTKSPQQIMGSLIKDSLSIELSMKQSQIYHVTIMPCYDKKLESSRKEFLIHPDSVLKDVDCVITTGELDLIMNKRKINLLDFQPSICVESLYCI